MNNNLLLIIPIALFATILVVNLVASAQATGGAGEIKGLIDPIIDRAIAAIENNNTELALEEIQTLKNELDDTFSTDEKEKDDDD